MKKFIYVTTLAIYFWSSNVFSQIEIGVQCTDCSANAAIAREQAALNALQTGDKVNVINMENGVLDSFSVNRVFNSRNGQFVYLVVSTNTSTELQLAFNEAITKLSEVIHALKGPEADIDVTTISNPCAGLGQKADSVWDLVACVPAVSKLTGRVENGEFTTLGASLTGKLLNLATTAGLPVMTTERAFEFDTSDGGKLVFKLTYSVISNDSVSINAEFDYAASTDSEGNPLDASSLESGTASGGGVYFTAGGSGGTAALQSFLQAAVRLGLVVDATNPTTGQMSCIMSSDGQKLVCTLI
jgi:hypothetical protein